MGRRRRPDTLSIRLLCPGGAGKGRGVKINYNSPSSVEHYVNLAKNPSINVAKNNAAVGVAAGCAAWHNDKMCRKCQTGEVDPGDGGEGCTTASHPKLQWAGFDLETEVGTVSVRASMCVPV